MGWTVLYIAFGVVALWLLGEVLLQYKARLRWRLLAFAGFSTVVVGVVVLSSVVVIALGAMAFAVGQTFVTLSYRRGFSTGWALGGMPGVSRRRRERSDDLEGEEAEPALEVSGLEEHRPDGDDGPGHAEAGYGRQGTDGHASGGYGAEDHEPGVFEPGGYDRPAYGPPAYDPPAYAPQPMPDETGEYGVYTREAYDEPAPYATAATQQAHPGDYGQDPAPDQDRQNGYDYGYGYAHGYGPGQEDQHQYAPYSDPYIGYDSGQYAGTDFDAFGTAAGYTDRQAYTEAGYGDGQDAYGGAWVPQQRESGRQPEPDQSYPYQDPYGVGGYGGGYGDDALGTGYGYGYPYAENGYPADPGYGTGYDPGAPGYDAQAAGNGYDEQRGY